ncbi:2-dehydropantoate 2-reductase [Deltaproteobacteria bacterium OttesenSCG-928-K17]|nr:2-dehydropantoate 2-reductase [Deltaproteobacteria bacterium OttesenSCG-928-K17]
MKIAVLGSGAMGGVYGSKLFEAGFDVTLIDIWKEHVQAIKEKGLQVDNLGEGKRHKPKVTDNPAEVGVVDLVIVLVKAYDTTSAMKGAVSLLGPGTVVVSLQNGIGNVEKLIEVVGADHVIGGVTSHGSYVVGPGHICHTGHSYTSIGELNGQTTDRIKKVGEVLEKAGLAPVVISDNVTKLIWKKLMGNISLNAISALCDIRNGQVIEFPEIREISRLAVEEAAAVARAKGIVIDYDPVEIGWKVITDTAPNRSSMLQDVSRHKQTEIDVINGAIVREGLTLGIPTPINQTLTALISVIQQTYNNE